MMAEAGGGERRGIGVRLRAAREKRGLTLLQAAERLHLDVRIVQALEAEEFAELGADVYVRGHLRRYAEAVGESPAPRAIALLRNATPASCSWTFPEPIRRALWPHSITTRADPHDG